MYAVHVTDVITETSTTNYIPAVYASIPVTGTTCKIGSFYFGQFDTNTITYTNEFKSNYHPFDYRLTNVWTSQTFAVTSGIVAFSIQRTETGGIFQAEMDVDTLRDYELYMAINERQIVLGYTNFPAWNHKSNRANLATVKAWLSSVCVNFIAPTASTVTASNQYDFTIVFDTPKTNGEYYTTLSHLLYTPSNLSLSCGSPTNYLTITPYKHLTPSVVPFGESVTTTVSIIRYPSDTNASPDAIRTNTVYLYNGTTTNVTGTNDQIVSVSVQMTNTLSGFTEDDYGYKNITNLFAKLIILPEENLTWSGSWSYTRMSQYYNVYYSTYKELFNETDYSSWEYFPIVGTNYPISASGPSADINGGIDTTDFKSWEEYDLLFSTTSEIESVYNYEFSEYISCSSATNQTISGIWYTKILASMNSTTLYTYVDNIGTPEIYADDFEYTYSAYRGIINSELITNANQTIITKVDASNIIIHVENAFGLRPGVKILYYSDDGGVTYNCLQEKKDDGASYSVGDNCLVFAEYDDYKASFIVSGIGYDKYAIKNYAVTNGFRYY